MVFVAPSLLAADFGHLKKEVELVEKAGAEWLHFDIMDGHFVPNLSYGPMVIEQMRPLSKLFFDVHLMVENPLNLLPLFWECGADLLTVHYEACPDLREVLREIKKHGKHAGVSLKPQTSEQVLEPFLDDIDTILIMSVEPGFGGQSFMPEVLPKIRQTVRMAEAYDICVEIDGGINLETGAQCLQNGADVLVAGNAVFKNENPAEIIRKFHQLGED